MGRPVNKRYFGTLAAKDGGTMPKGDDEFNITAIVKVGSNAVSETGIILRQRTETKFKVDDAANGTGNEGICELVDKDVPGDNEMVVKGYVTGSGDGVNIRKFHNRTVIDFANNRYTWEIDDDSSQTLLVLTAI